jgi:hypothetical protein
MLARINIQSKEFKKALKYTNMFVYVYPERSWCGTGIDGASTTAAVLYALYYIGIGQNEKAIELLDKYLFNPSAFADHKEAIRVVVPLLKEKYGEELVKHDIKSNKLMMRYEYHAVLKFLGKEYEIHLLEPPFINTMFQLKEGKITYSELEEKINEDFKNHFTYKLIMEN